MSNIVLLDNLDSFSYNLIDQLHCLNHKVFIYRNTIPINLIIKKIEYLDNPILILSPGPGIPKNAGCMPELINISRGYMPIIGICLGHQAIIESYGGKISLAKEILHGKSSFIHHDNKYMFKGLTNPLSVARYHSLIGKDIPSELIINAYYNNMIMAIRNNKDNICGFQFHPESILTTHGSLLIQQTLSWVKHNI
ncbi:MAG: anthranilate synthase component II [Pantoea sp. Brub]|nr:anthranilate synthase component II [Pantoea sp. Brub]